MDLETAKRELGYHAGRGELNGSRVEEGFLWRLRPYKNLHLVEECFHHIIECLRVIGPSIASDSKRTIEIDIVTDIASIICFGRLWAVHEEGTLRRNKLIAKEEATQIEQWINRISWTWTMLLTTKNVDTAFEEYDREFRNK